MPSPLALAETVAALDSAEAEASILADPYWPKWDSPWWRMTLLHELGLAAAIPRRAVAAMVRALGSHYLPSFPLAGEELPPGKDPHRHVACHCALGTIYQVLFACGVEVDAELPWIRPWFLRYQLPDGGLNCDELAYTRPTPRSSLVSTLPPLEAMLLCTPRPFTVEEESFLDRGARYLIDRRLCRSLSRGGELMNADWLRPCFPRFYHYDLLRGLAFLVAWSKRRAQPLPGAAIAEALAGMERLAEAAGGEILVGRRAWSGAWSKRQVGELWVEGSAASFPLLEEVSRIGDASPELSRQWAAVRRELALERRGE